MSAAAAAAHSPAAAGGGWAQARLGDHLYLVSFTHSEAGCQLRLTDNRLLYRERLDRPAFAARFEALNPDLEDCRVEDGMEGVRAALADLDNVRRVAFSQEEGGGRELSLDWSMEGIPYRWRFQLARATEEEFHREVTVCLATALHLLLQERRQLFAIIRDKDLEVEDYVNGGAKLSKKSLKTEWFDQKKFVQSGGPAGGLDDDETVDDLKLLGGGDVAALLAKAELRRSRQNGGEQAAASPVKNGRVPKKIDKAKQNEEVAALKRKVDRPVFKPVDKEKKKKMDKLRKL